MTSGSLFSNYACTFWLSLFLLHHLLYTFGLSLPSLPPYLPPSLRLQSMPMAWTTSPRSPLPAPFLASPSTGPPQTWTFSLSSQSTKKPAFLSKRSKISPPGFGLGIRARGQFDSPQSVARAFAIRTGRRSPIKSRFRFFPGSNWSDQLAAVCSSRTTGMHRSSPIEMECLA